MPADFQSAFEALKVVFAPYTDRLLVSVDSPTNYAVYSRVPSPFPQHKGQGMYFGSVQIGKAYVAFHLMPLYMNGPLTASISPALKKRMQGKTCFNFKTVPDVELLSELKRLAADGFAFFAGQKWI